MAIAVGDAVRRYGRWVASRVTGSAIILIYHRVADLETDPQILAVRPKNFAEQMAVLRSIGNPIPLTSLVDGIQNRKLVRKGILVTFDDGYADNLLNAKPVLERTETPATVFVASGYVESGQEYWWDELERLLLHPGKLPKDLTLHVGQAEWSWHLDGASAYSEDDRRRNIGWTVKDAPPTARHSLYLDLHRKIRPLAPGQRAKVLETLRAWAGTDSRGRETHRAMTAAEVRALAGGGLVEVGAHTVSHPMLSGVDAKTQNHEVAQSKVSLEEILGRRVTSFAYPYGAVTDYNAESIAAVRRAGFKCACSNFPSRIRIRPDNDSFQLPRILVRDWNGDEFARRLREWFVDA